LETIKAAGGWKSSSVAEHYIDESEDMKSKIARSIQQSDLPEPEVRNDLSNVEKNVHAAIISGLHMTFNTLCPPGPHTCL
jgi:hypothetical protein